MKILQDKKNKVVFSGGYGGEGVGASFLGGGLLLIWFLGEIVWRFYALGYL